MFQLTFGQNCPSVGHLTTKLTQWESLLQKYCNWNVPFLRQKTWMEECIQCKSHHQVQTRYFILYIIPVFAPSLCLCHCLCICLCLRFVCTILLYLQTPGEHSVLPKTPEEGWLVGWLVTGCSLKAIRRCYPKMLSTHFAGILSLATTAILLEMRLEICTRDSRVQFLT